MFLVTRAISGRLVASSWGLIAGMAGATAAAGVCVGGLAAVAVAVGGGRLWKILVIIVVVIICIAIYFAITTAIRRSTRIDLFPRTDGVRIQPALALENAKLSTGNGTAFWLLHVQYADEEGRARFAKVLVNGWVLRRYLRALEIVFEEGKPHKPSLLMMNPEVYRPRNPSRR